MKKIFNILIVLMLMFVTVVPVFAEDTVTTETPNLIGNTSDGQIKENLEKTEEEKTDATIKTIQERDFINEVIESEDATIDSLGEKFLRLGYNIANWMIRMSLPISIIGFIIGVLLFLWGAMSKRATVMPGVFTMLASAVVFIVAMNSTEILTSLNNWFMGV